MSHFNSLNGALNEVLQVIKPSSEDWEVRFQIINDIRVAVSSVESLRGAIVEPFGSFASNLFTRWGDLDISIELPNGSCISSAAKKRKQRLLGDILRALRQNAKTPISEAFHLTEDCRSALRNAYASQSRLVAIPVHHLNIEKWFDFGNLILSSTSKQKGLHSALMPQGNQCVECGLLCSAGGWYKLQFIPHARVPILKSVSNRQAISCDISIDNLAGLMKSRFLFWISEIDGRFRDMVLLVKEWARAHDVNNSKFGTLNSYSLSLLVIFHFQTCVPAILPPLQEIFPGNMVDDLAGVRDDALRRISDICVARIASLKSDKSRAINRSSLSELFISFFAKFSDLSSKASQQGISPYRGQWEDIGGNTRWLPKTYSIFIEDPLEQPQNTARSVGGRQLERISEAFQMTHFHLSSVSHNPISILATIATRRTSKSVERIRANHHSQTGFTRPRTTLHTHGSNRANLGYNSSARTSTLNIRPQKTQQQGSSSRPENSFNMRPQVRSNGAEQQIWRPKSRSSFS